MSSDRNQFSLNSDLRGNSDPNYWVDFIDRSDLQGFKDQAYVNPDGIAIRINPVTGYKELFIAGSRTRGDWYQNIAETGASLFHKISKFLEIKGLYDKGVKAFQYDAEALDPTGAIIMESTQNVFDTSSTARDNYSDYIDSIIRKNDIEVVYGHSRGSAIMSGLHSDVIKIGIDGATFIGHEDQDFVNLVQPTNEGFAFDKLISTGYKHNVKLPGRAFHDVTHKKEFGSSRPPKPTAVSVSRARKRSKRSKWTRAREFIRVFDKATGRMSKSDHLVRLKKIQH